ncbi:helix-turn-helix transcriptional regulator [Rhodophyticola sp. SM2404]
MTRFIRRPAVENRTGLSRSTIYLLMQNGQFPKPVRIGSRAVAWPEAEVEAWLNARLAEREEAR